MKNINLLLLLAILFFNCKSVQSQSTQNNLSPIKMTVDSYELNDDIIIFKMKITNNSKEEISILKPRPIKRRGGFAPPSIVPPDFFNVKLINQTKICILTEPNDASAQQVKSERDVLTIAPNSAASFNLKVSDYGEYYCDEKKLDIDIIYEFDNRLIDKAFFDNKISSHINLSPEEREKLHAMILKTYQGKLSVRASMSK